MNNEKEEKIFGKTIIPFGVFVEQHELDVAKVLNKLGKDVEFILPSRVKFSRTPDIKMDGLLWEIKSPKGSSSRTIETNLRCASKQARNIIIDLRRIKIDEPRCISHIKREVNFRKVIKNIIIIRKNSEVIQILDIKR